MGGKQFAKAKMFSQLSKKCFLLRYFFNDLQCVGGCNATDILLPFKCEEVVLLVLYSVSQIKRHNLWMDGSSMPRGLLKNTSQPIL